MAFISLRLRDNKGMFKDGKAAMVEGKQLPSRTVDFSTEASFIRNSSVKMPLGFALSIQAKMHARAVENSPFYISYQCLDEEPHDPMKVTQISKIGANTKPPTEATMDGTEEGALAPTSMQVDEGALDKFEDGITILLDLKFTIPGTKSFQSLPKWKAFTANRANGREQAEAYSMPDPYFSNCKISFAKIRGPALTGKGGYVGYLVHRMSALPPPFIDDPQTKRMLLSMYGPMQKEIDLFVTTMKKASPQGEHDLAEALHEWRGMGAIAKLLQGCLEEGLRRAGKGKVTHTGGKSTKGGPASGKGFGDFRKGGGKRERESGGGKGPRSIKGKITAPAVTQRQVSQTSSVEQTSSVGRDSSSSSNLRWHPTLSSSTSSARRTHESSSPVRNWQ
jgi:hypothetical protein